MPSGESRRTSGPTLKKYINELLRYEGQKLSSETPARAKWATWLSGGSRLRHIRYIASDFLVKRVVGVKRVATERTLSRWLARFTPTTIDVLNQMNAFFVLGTLAALKPKRLTLDFDGTVLSTGDEVENAARRRSLRRQDAHLEMDRCAGLDQPAQAVLQGC